MTTVYKFKAGYTKLGIATAPASAPVITIVDSDNNILVNAQPATALSNLTGTYLYSYSGADGLDLVGMFHTADTTVDHQDLYSYTPDILTDLLTTTALTTITAPVLADYLTLNFTSVKTQLGWSDSIEITAVINKTFQSYGVDTEAEATDLTKLHALADVAVWRQALNDISLDYNWSADGASYSRSQAVTAIRENLMYAESVAIAYNPAYNITVHTLDNNPDWRE